MNTCLFTVWLKATAAQTAEPNTLSIIQKVDAGWTPVAQNITPTGASVQPV